MEKFKYSRSAQFPHSRSRESKDSTSKKNLLTSFKNYVLSKFRSDKYEVNEKISILSYDHHTFNEVEKKYDLIPSTANEKLTRAIRTALSQISGEEMALMSQERMELLQIIERTFNRQMDIFEGLVGHINVDNTRGKTLFKKHIKAIDEGPSDIFLNHLVDKMKTAVESTPEVANLTQESEEQNKNDLGDNSDVKMVDIYCECQKINANGAAVPSVSPFED